MDIHKKIEAILFFKGEPVSIKELINTLSLKEGDVVAGIEALEERLKNSGLRLMRKDEEVMLGTAPELSPYVEKMLKEDLDKDLGKAGTETLSVILYLGPVARSEIDYIRGVNSNFILRRLMVRGLVEKIANPKDKRGFLYRPTFELLAYLGVARVEDLPEYASVRKEMDSFKADIDEEKEAGEENELSDDEI